MIHLDHPPRDTVANHGCIVSTQPTQHAQPAFFLVLFSRFLSVHRAACSLVHTAVLEVHVVLVVVAAKERGVKVASARSVREARARYAVGRQGPRSGGYLLGREEWIRGRLGVPERMRGNQD
jgi:hypothetical protein